jgi:beta-lactamase regulating signal transducer with metallopeptidase domain/protocatechuate 3,4-dioxygenase beta subunit
MSGAEWLFQQPWMTRAGWTLVHFLWQGSAIAILLAAVRALAGRRLTARSRYALACAALTIMTAAPLATFLVSADVDGAAAARPVWPVAGGADWDRVLPWLVVVWLTGVVVCSARIAAGWRMAARLRTAGTGPAPGEWQQALDELIHRMRVSAPVRLLVSSLAPVPSVVGWLRPVILMPVEAVAGLPMEQIRALVAHELAHILRQDYLVNILQSMAEAVLFYHPAVWWVSGQIRVERELCCDDLAVEASGDVVEYATALAGLDSSRRARLGGMLAATGGSLLDRIRRLAGISEPVSQLPAPGAVWALAVLWLTGIGAVAMHAAAPPQVQPGHEALRPFAAPGMAAAPAVLLDPPPPVKSARAPLMVSALLFDPFFAAPQAPAAPAQTAPDAQKQLATIAGTAATNSGTPVRGATVTLYHMADPQAAGSMDNMQTAQTDDGGKFSFERLQPGQYLMIVTHPKYRLMVFGGHGASDSSPISLAEGQQMTGIKMVFADPGTVSGRVVDEDGDPIAGANVQVLEFIHYNGRRISSTVSQVTSGDNGQFKVDKVAPGRYILRVDTQPAWRSNERAPVPSVKPGQKDIRPHCTYYGGGHEERTAAPIDIVGGADLPLGNVKMLNAFMAHVRGKVLGDPTLLQGARVVRMPGSPTSALGWSYGADIGKDGSFDMANMWSDTFAIEVLSLRYNTALGWARIVVGDEDLEGVKIDAAAGPLHGTVKLAEDEPAATAPPATAPATGTTAPAAAPSKSLGRIQLTAAGIPEVMQVTGMVSSDGSFTIPLVAPGMYLADVIGLPQGSYLKSAHFNGINALDPGFEWGGDQKGTLEVVISSRAATLSGTVQDNDGKPAPGATVTLVPDPPRPAVARLYPTAKTDEQGQFNLSGITPGNYRVYAWEQIGASAHWNQDYVRPFGGSSERVELVEGATGTVTLKRISKAAMEEALRRAGL